MAEGVVCEPCPCRVRRHRRLRSCRLDPPSARQPVLLRGDADQRKGQLCVRGVRCGFPTLGHGAGWPVGLGLRPAHGGPKPDWWRICWPDSLTTRLVNCWPSEVFLDWVSVTIA